ncbi:MAG TPA: PqiC family protein, partial [Rhodocyclaceae bacterium]|nr:PqiC family protein [Rhodocyclaceae bacterium]
MTCLARTICLMVVVGLCGCAGSPPVRYFALDDGLPTTLGAEDGPRVAITQVNLPDLIDRPQLVMRVGGNQVKVSDQDRWGEPLRRQLPRLLARDVGIVLGSGRVVALPVDVERFDMDFRVSVDIQRLDVVSGRWVELDAIWRVEPR